MAIRVVLKDDWPLDRIESIVFELEWGYVDTVVETETLPFQKIWSTQLDARVRYTEDPWIGLRYFYVEGPDEGSIAETILTSFATYSREELLAQAAAAEEQGLKSAAVRRLLVGTGHAVGADVVKAAERFFGDADPIVRRDAVVASGYAPSPALRERVATLARQDPDAEVREASQGMLKGG